MASLRQLATLLLLLFVFSFATAAASPSAAGLQYSSSPFPPAPAGFSPAPPQDPVASQHASAFLAPILSNLGFRELAMAVPGVASPFLSVWFGPVTIFAPSDDSIHSCLSCSPLLVLREHLVPGLFSHLQLSNLAFGTKLETSVPGRCLTVTSTPAAADRSGVVKVLVDGVQITRPDLFNDGRVVVHGIQGFIGPFSPLSCNRLVPIRGHSSDGFVSSPLGRPGSVIVQLMLRDAIVRLKEGGYSLLALAMIIKFPELSTLHNMTVFALDNEAIFAGGHSYVSSVLFHVVPNCLLMLADLAKMPAGTVLPTLVDGRSLVVTHASGPGDPTGSGLLINYVPIKVPDVVYNLRIAVHGIFLPFPHILLPDVPLLAGQGLTSTGDSIFDPPSAQRAGGEGVFGSGSCNAAAVFPGGCCSGGPSFVADPVNLDDDGL